MPKKAGPIYKKYKKRHALSKRYFKYQLKKKRGLGRMLVHFFRRSPELSQISGNDSQPQVKGAFTFTLQDLPAYTEFTNLYDQFRILGVRLQMKLNVSPDAQTASTSNYPVLYYVRDYDDNTAPTTTSEINQYANLKKKVLRPNSFVNIYLKPAVLVQTYETSVATGYSPKWKQWIDCTDSATQYFAMKYYIDGLWSRYEVDVHSTYYLQFRNPR